MNDITAKYQQIDAKKNDIMHLCCVVNEVNWIIVKPFVTWTPFHHIWMIHSIRERSNSFFILPETRLWKTCGSEIKVKRKSPIGTIAQFHLYLFYTQNKQRKESRRKRRWMKYEVGSLSCRFVFLTETNWTPLVPTTHTFLVKKRTLEKVNLR